MIEELEALKKYLHVKNSYQLFELTFYEGQLENHDCILVESGIGKVNSARTTQILVDNFKVDCIFNIGIAGGISNKLEVGDIVVAEKLVQHDFDITAFNHEKGYIPKIGTYIESDKYLLNKAKTINNDHIYYGTIASGDIFCTDDKMSTKIATKFNALCVEMEGASIAQVCYLNLIPFLVIRSISDVPGNNNVITYEKFLNNSTKKIALYIKSLIKII